MDEAIKMRFRRIWEHAKVMGVMLFSMAAGAAAYHQYIVQNQPSGPVKAEVITICQIETVPATEPVRTREKESPEEPEGEELPGEDLEEEAMMDELELLAVCVEAEAGNQGLTGKRMVADVVLNRVDDPDFPDTIYGVISQENAFTSYWDGGMDRVDLSEETIRAMQMELEQRSWPGLIYFTADGWPEYGTPWKQVGDHYFSTK